MNKERMILIFLAIYSCVTTVYAENEYPIIGIVAQELNPSLQEVHPAYSSFIAAGYVKAAESSAMRVVPIVTGRNESYYREVLKSVNGIILPGGLVHPRDGRPYWETAKIIYQISKEINDQGITFPILGVCLGYRILLLLANRGGNFFMTCNIDHENLPLKFTVPYAQTKFFSRLSEKEYGILSSSNVTANNHITCFLENDFLKSSAKDEWLVTSLSTAANGLEFIASVEHKKYPFFGVQFHPEKIAYEWERASNFPHSADALIANRYFYDALAYFSRKNENKFESSLRESRSLIYNHLAVIPKNGQYEQVYFF